MKSIKHLAGIAIDFMDHPIGAWLSEPGNLKWFQQRAWSKSLDFGYGAMGAEYMIDRMYKRIVRELRTGRCSYKPEQYPDSQQRFLNDRLRYFARDYPRLASTQRNISIDATPFELPWTRTRDREALLRSLMHHLSASDQQFLQWLIEGRRQESIASELGIRQYAVSRRRAEIIKYLQSVVNEPMAA